MSRAWCLKTFAFSTNYRQRQKKMKAAILNEVIDTENLFLNVISISKCKLSFGWDCHTRLQLEPNIK